MYKRQQIRLPDYQSYLLQKKPATVSYLAHITILPLTMLSYNSIKHNAELMLFRLTGAGLTSWL